MSGGKVVMRLIIRDGTCVRFEGCVGDGGLYAVRSLQMKKSDYGRRSKMLTLKDLARGRMGFMMME